MKKLRIHFSIISLAFVLFAAPVNRAQTPAAVAPATDASQPTDDEKQKEKEALEKKATALLEQILNDVQMLKLPENRLRVQIAAGDLLWKRNESRARSMFSLAGEGIAELMRNQDNNSRRASGQLRQELVLTAALHDAQLAYQLVATTKTPVAPGDSDPNNRRGNSDASIEQSLLALVARTDPKLAAQKAEEALEKDQFPITLTRVLAELQTKDKEAFTKLSERVVGKLLTANMLSNSESGALALSLLQAGPRPAEKATDSGTAPTVQGRTFNVPILNQSVFPDLLGVVIDGALKMTPPSATQRAGNQRQQGGARGRMPVVTGGSDIQLTDAQIEQNNARRLLFGLQNLLPQIDQFAPSRATAVRQKLTEAGGSGNARQTLGSFNLMNQQSTTTADSILEAAPNAPPQLQPRLYQQAALKALDEGNADRARQIANEHLDTRTRDSVLQRVEFQLIAKKIEADNMDQLRQSLAELRNDDERIDLLLQMVALQNKDKVLAAKLLGEAQRLTNRHATNYRQFEQQLAVSSAFAPIDPARSLEVLDPGISQLNELLSAAAVLSGFEVSVFRDGEMPLEPGNTLTSMVARYGQQIAALATKDFERAETSANKFQLTEPRLIARLAIVRGVLGGSQFGAFGGFGGRPPVRVIQ